MAIATALGFLGIVFFIASNPAFEMLSLSQRYAAAVAIRSTKPRRPTTDAPPAVRHLGPCSPTWDS
jgi:hypothetical protein